jgi:integrase
MRKKLTDKTVANVQPPKKGRLELADTLEPGLALRVTDGDVRTWAVRVWTGPATARKQRRVTIGHPRERDGARVLTLAQAREAARSVKIAAAEGRPLVAGDGLKGAMTWGELSDKYIAAIKPARRAKTMSEIERILRHRDLAEWRHRPAVSIAPDDVRGLRDIVHERGPVMGTRYVRTVSALGTWAVSEGLLAESPTRGVKPRASEKERERVLDDAEIAAFWRACERLGYTLGHIGQMLLLTATRLRETGHAEWKEVDLSTRTWTVPCERTKNRKPLVVHLSGPLLAILRELEKQRDRIEMLRASPFIFTSTVGKRFVDFARLKTRIDAEMAKEMDEPLAHWTHHDLRRSAATTMARLKIAPHVVEKVLNHSKGESLGGPVARIYNRHAYLPERKQALDALGKFVTALAEPKVVAMRRA